MAAFVLAVYAVVVLGGDALIGRSDSPALALSVLATSVVALGFEPVQRRLEVVVPRRSRAPYDVLRRFGSTGTPMVPSGRRCRAGWRVCWARA